MTLVETVARAIKEERSKGPPETVEARVFIAVHKVLRDWGRNSGTEMRSRQGDRQ